MLIVKSNPLELRGIAHKETKQKKVYYVVNCEEEDGTSHAFYCPDANAFPQDLKKGEMVNVTFEVNYFNNQERLVVKSVSKVK